MLLRLRGGTPKSTATRDNERDAGREWPNNFKSCSRQEADQRTMDMKIRQRNKSPWSLIIIVEASQKRNG